MCCPPESETREMGDRILTVIGRWGKDLATCFPANIKGAGLGN